jgi:hypothetical protein
MLGCALRNVRCHGSLRCYPGVRCGAGAAARRLSTRALQSASVAPTSFKAAAAVTGARTSPCCNYQQVRTLSAEQTAAAIETTPMSARDYWCAAADAVVNRSSSWRSIHYKLHRAREQQQQQQQQQHSQQQSQQQQPQQFVHDLLPSALTRIEQVFTFPEQEHASQQSKLSRGRTKRRLLRRCNTALELYEAALQQIALAQRSGDRKLLLKQYMEALEACVVLQAYDAATQLVAGMQSDKFQVTQYAW